MRTNKIDENRVIVFDTTLRDGEQSPGASMNTDEKIMIAIQLEKLGVDVIEAGFAAASEGDFDAISKIASAVNNSRICSLARAVDNDIKRAGEAIKNVRNALNLIARSKPGDQLLIRGVRDDGEFEIEAEVSIRPLEPQANGKTATEKPGS